MSFLLGVLLLIDRLLVSCLLGSKSSLSLLDFSDGFFSESLFVLRSGVFHFFDVIKSDSLDGSLFSEDFLLLALSVLGKL